MLQQAIGSLVLHNHAQLKLPFLSLRKNGFYLSGENHEKIGWAIYPVLKKIQRLLSLFRLDSSVLDFSRRQLSAIHNICPHSLEWLLKVIAGHCQLLPEGERGRGRRDFDQSDSLSSLEWRTN